MKKISLRKAVALVLGGAALATVTTHASAGIGVSTGVLAYTGSAVSYTPNYQIGYKAWSDYGTNNNYGWSHTAGWYVIKIGSDTDISNNATHDVKLELANADNRSGFSIWTSGIAPTTTSIGNGVGFHKYNQVRGANDGGITTNFALSGTYGNIINGHDGWVGYAQNGTTFTNGDGDVVAHGGSANMTSGVVSGYSVDVSNNATLSLYGLASGYYLIGFGGACPDGQTTQCITPGATSSTYTLSVSPVPIPAAAWFFGPALAGLGAVLRRKPVKG